MAVFILLTGLAYSADIFKVASSSSLDMSRFPPMDAVVPVNPAFVAKFDLSNVPRIAVNSPRANLGPHSCNSTNSTNFSAAGSCSWSCGLCTRPTDKITCDGPNKWALTFDDGPAVFTDNVLDYLASEGILASFYVVGSRVKEYPAIVKRMYEEGHQIGIHSYSHRALSTLSNEEIVSELEWTISAIEQITGQRPKYVRPPFGDHDDRVRAIFNAMGLVNSMWDYDTEDWRLFRTPDAFPGTSLEDNIKQKALNSENLPQGVISIQHDLYEKAMDRAPGMIKNILETKMVPMPLSECVSDFTPYLNTGIVLPKSLSIEKVKVPVRSTPGTKTGSNNGSKGSQSSVGIILSLCFSLFVLSTINSIWV